jgi:hypothetical protein
MTSLGLSIAIRDSQIKEVFVCSSDRDLHHLSHSLLSHGVKCYRVSRQGNDLIIRDVKSSLDRIYSLSTPSLLPNRCYLWRTVSNSAKN